MVAKLTDVGRSREVAGEQSNSDWDPATELLRSGGYIDKVSDDLHLHHADIYTECAGRWPGDVS